MSTLKKYIPTLLMLLAAFALSVLTQSLTLFSVIFNGPLTGFYLAIALLILTGLFVARVAPKTTVPVYVWAILFGIALQAPMKTIIEDQNTLLLLVEFIAAFILFASGITVPIKNFKKYFAPIAALSLFGTILSIFIFALVLSYLAGAFGLMVSALSLIILAAILSSIDPASILPTFEHLHFRRPFLKDLAISESAINDVVGIIITRFFLIAALGAGTTTIGLTVSSQFSILFSRTAFDFFAVVIVWGVMIGMLGAWILKTWGEVIGKRHWSDPALFIAVPIFCYALGSLIPGAGFLAAFVAGMLYEVHAKAIEVHAFFDSLVDRFLKPITFVLLGAVVPLSVIALPEIVVVGAFSAIMFMFVVRPFVVFVSLSPWMFTKKALLHWREVLFISFLRETGAIAAILILYSFARGLLDVEIIYAIGVWVILYTLILEPPLTPLIAKRLEVVD